jgi:ectoine hydroxylase-related dioxygenase (phytanoyl-CoA dioxygenase family)
MQTTEKSNLKNYFEENGYVVIDTELDSALFDDVITSLAPYFGDQRVEPQGVTFADYGRVQDAWYLNTSVWKIATSKVVYKVLRELYGVTPKPFQTLNFYKGTHQSTHADSIHFNCEPFGMMCGVWVALEDIGPDQGPLRLYPGSHKLPEMNYQDFGLEPSQSQYPQYLKGIEGLIKKHSFTERRATISRGQAVIWAANVLHGGAPQNDLSLSRHSQVSHYYMGKPNAWKPSQSQDGRRYFEPESVRDIHGWEHRLHCYQIRLRELLGLQKS